MTDTTTSHPSATARNAAASDHRRCATRLRLVLRLNAANSVLAGSLLAAVPSRVDDLLDTGHPGWIRVVGLALLPFAALCVWVSTASLRQLRRVTPAIIGGDVSWVVASLATVLAGWYSGGGAVAVLAMAGVVDLFALLQWSAWRTLRPTR